MTGSEVEAFPATPERWEDVAAVFEDGGYAGKCWCAYWYLSNKAYRAGETGDNRIHLQEQVASDRRPGVIAYVGGEPAAWLSLAPRTRFDRLNRSKPLAPVDTNIDTDSIWAMNCFVVRKKFRRKGLMRALIRAGIDFVGSQGGKAIEAYPVDGDGRTGSYDLFLGTPAAFTELGFREIARRLPRRPILRLDLD